MEAMLSLSHVGYSYHTVDGETPALTDVNFTVDSGEFVAIVGPSGCGKSTLLSLICGLIQPETGQILLNGQPHTTSRQIGYMLQKDHLFEWRTICRNVLLGLEIQHNITEEHLARIDRMMTVYGLSAFTHRPPSSLSGGMKQRAALIRTLALDPQLLLLDEPFGALDAFTRMNMQQELLRIWEQDNTTMVIVTHDIDEAILLSDRIYLLTGKPGTITKEIVIKEQKPRAKDFNLSEEFLRYKKEIISHLEGLE